MTVLSFRLEDEIIDKLKEYASSLNTSTSSLLRDLICRELSCPPPRKAPPISSDKGTSVEKNTLHNEVKQLRHEQDNLWAHIEELTCRLSELQQYVNSLPVAAQPRITVPSQHQITAPSQHQITSPSKPSVTEPVTAGARKRFRPQLPIEMVSLDKIIVPPRYSSIQPQPDRIQRHIRYYERYGRFNGAITVMRGTLSLVDGYMRYLAAQKMGHKEIATHLLS